MRKQAIIPSNKLINIGVKILKKVHKTIITSMSFEAKTALTIWRSRSKDKSNITRAIDIVTQGICSASLYEKFGKKIVVWGEENLMKGLNLSQESRTVALLDMVDGTDLLATEMSNWCSAIVFFNPLARDISAALICDPGGQIYYAHASEEKAYRIGLDDSGPTKIQCSKTKTLANARICYYGQKGERADLSLKFHSAKLRRRMGDMGRIYGFGGNPMMVQVANGKKDSVFEFHGQLPHDAVPGLYIAKKAGANLKDSNGNDMSYDYLLKSLLKPCDRRIKYVLASTEALSSEILSLLKQRPKKKK